MESIGTIGQYIAMKVEAVEYKLAEAFPAAWEIPAELRAAMDYSLMAGGKRLRPILAIVAAESLGGTMESVMPVACAIELIHTYSLIHDDLPALDDDDLRRGKPTNHKVYGEAMAILAGDALLTHAFFSVVQAFRIAAVPAEQTLDMIEDLAVLSGAKGMVGGQAADMRGEQGITRIDELEYIHRHKTGDLIVFALKAGGRIAGASPNQLAALERYGYQMGLAFQIQDDILDIIGEETKIGKPTRSDQKMRKVTYPYLVGLENSKRKARQLTEEAKAAIAEFPFPQRLAQIADYLMNRDR